DPIELITEALIPQCWLCTGHYVRWKIDFKPEPTQPVKYVVVQHIVSGMAVRHCASVASGTDCTGSVQCVDTELRDCVHSVYEYLGVFEWKYQNGMLVPVFDRQPEDEWCNPGASGNCLCYGNQFVRADVRLFA